MEVIERFIQARQAMGGDPDFAVTTCQGLLDDPANFNDQEVGVRRGDVYSLLVENHYAAGMVDQCGMLLQVSGKNALHVNVSCRKGPL